MTRDPVTMNNPGCTPRTYRFADFLCDALNRSLFRGGVEIALTPKTRDLLLIFLENPARLLTRQGISVGVFVQTRFCSDVIRRNSYVYRCVRSLSDLCLVEGLKRGKRLSSLS